MSSVDYISILLITLVCFFFFSSFFSYRRMYSFYKKLVYPEFIFLCGRLKITKRIIIPFSNLIILFFIISLSLFSMGFGKGLISHLSEKMDSPWVSFVYTKTEKNFKYDDYLNYSEPKNDSIKRKEEEKFLDLHGLEVLPKQIFQTLAKFENPNTGLEKTLKVRKISSDSKLLEELKKTDLFLSKNKYITSNYGYGIVVSVEWLKEFSNQKISDVKLPHYLFLSIPRYLNGKKINEKFPIPITGVVENLPNGVHALAKQDLFTMLNQDWSSFNTIPLKGTGRYTDQIDFFVVDTTTKSFEQLKQNYKLTKGTVNYITKNQRSGTIISPYSQIFKIQNLDSISYMSLKNKIDKHPSNFYHIYNYAEVAGHENDDDSHIMQFKFKKEELGKIETFNDFLKVHEQNLDMSIVKSKENFDLFNKLAISLSAILAFFSIVSVILYITNLVTSHISRNKKNLGTLKAFGLSNNNITFIYSCISLGIVLFAFLSSYLFCEFLGDYFIKYLTNQFFNIQDTSDIFYESYSIYTLFGIFIGIPFLFIYFKLKSSLRGTTPGDLIYERG